MSEGDAPTKDEAAESEPKPAAKGEPAAAPAGAPEGEPAAAPAGAPEAATASSSSGPRSRSVVKKAAKASDDVSEDELDRLLAKQRARKKFRQKKLQYNFIFKAGAFLVMLVVVLVTKQFQKWFKPEGPQGTATSKTSAATSGPAPDVTKSPEGKEGEL
eukprot:CAMPEP_0195108006 /NCGR_PEP_ID=MMETSP0448-20130528/83157_1 /TAXON_ID=66468 /ORGANISM="Heterocapsa triquestra, Strain CCMP 448" /LENGTH=158 /DNA_ID=CAMNT_0040144505 /DNA_START=36 /DNA_END=512 /DNA_ORIENTATION=-